LERKKPMDNLIVHWGKLQYRWPVFLLLGIAGLVLIGCLCTGPAVDPAALLLEASDLPVEWEVCGGGRTSDPGAEEAGAFIEFCFSGYELVQTEERIYRYCNAGRAAQEYEHLVTFPNPPFPQEYVPEALQRLKVTATRWQARCTDRFFLGIVYCGFTAQYDEYVVLFTAPITVDGQVRMTVPQFASIVEKIDRKMAGRASTGTPTPGD